MWHKIADKDHSRPDTLKIAKTIAMEMTRRDETATTMIVRVVMNRKTTQMEASTSKESVTKDASQGAHIQGHMVTSMSFCLTLYQAQIKDAISPPR